MMDRKVGTMQIKMTLVDAKTGTVLHEDYLITRDADHPFASGKVGYNANGKVNLPDVDGDGIAKHQLSLNIVKVVPKPKS